VRESVARGEKATQLVDLSDNEPGDVKTEPKLENGAVKAEEKAPPKAPPKGWKIPTQSLEALYRTGAELVEIGASNDDVQQSSSSCQSPSTSNADPQTTLQDLYRTGEELMRRLSCEGNDEDTTTNGNNQ